MGVTDRKIKRRLLREVVEENVDLIQGRRPRPRASGSGLAGRLGRWATLVFAPAALLVSSLALSGSVGAHREAPVSFTDLAADRTAPAPVSFAAISSTSPVTVPLSPEAGLALSASRLPTAPTPRRLDENLLLNGSRVTGDVFPLAVRRIVLDAGHGGHNSGTRTPGGIEEKVLTLDITRRVRDALVDAPFEVLLTRDDDRSITLDERADFANRARADIFISIHVNWFEGVRASGIETYYLGPTDDPFLTRFAAQENRESGHTMAELRDLVEGIYSDVRQDRSRHLAGSIHDALFRALERVNPVVKDRGVKTAPFIVLVDTEMPAILAEVATASSRAEAEMLEKPLYRQYIADALAAGIRAYADSLSSPGLDAPPRTADVTDAGR